MEFRIRPALVSDAWGIARVHVHSWQESYKNIIAPDALNQLHITDRWHRWENILAEDKETNWVCESIPQIDSTDNNFTRKIIGFASTGISRDPDLENKLELYGLYLDPEYFGQGFGYALINTAIAQQSAVLWVLEGNDRAYQFYLRQGFYADGQKGVFPFQGKEYIKLRMQRE